MNNTSTSRVKECFFKLKLRCGLAATTSINKKNKVKGKPLKKLDLYTVLLLPAIGYNLQRGTSNTIPKLVH